MFVGRFSLDLSSCHLQSRNMCYVPVGVEGNPSRQEICLFDSRGHICKWQPVSRGIRHGGNAGPNEAEGYLESPKGTVRKDLGERLPKNFAG